MSGGSGLTPPDFWLPIEQYGFEWDSDHPFYFQLSYSQGDYAQVRGRLDVVKYLEVMGQTADYLAAVTAMQQGDLSKWANVSGFNDRCYSRATMDDYMPGSPNYDEVCTSNYGVFAGMDWNEFEELASEQYGDLETYMTEVVEGWSHDLYRALRDEYEYLCSEESYIEHCEANEITFEVEVDDEGDC